MTPPILPATPNITFPESSFFHRSSQLPLPDEVRTRARLISDFGKLSGGTRPPPVQVRSLGLLVKYGSEVTIAEGQCLFALRQLFRGAVPVPEVYGWCKDGQEVFIYMGLVQGETLERQWDTMDSEECLGVCKELRMIMDNVRRLEQDPEHPFIGEPIQILWSDGHANL